jgi:hypothetical protein
LPLVSIIIPCYRQGRFLAAAVQAAFVQSYPYLEIVVVNDGSDDDTDAVALGFGSRIVYVRKPNGGLASARNAGIRVARGKYLHFLDADDSISATSIERLVNAAEAGGGCIALMGYRTFEQPGEWIGGEEAPTGESLFPWLLVRNYPVHCWLVPRELANAVGGFEETMPTHEDHEFWVRVAALSSAMRRVEERGAEYRQHPGSMSRGLVRMGLGRMRLLKKTTEVVLDDPKLAAGHGGKLLRHLYVCRWIFAAQTPSLDRSELDRCIVRLQRAGVRTKFPVDWAYTLIPKPMLPVMDRAVLVLLGWAVPRKFAELHGSHLRPAGGGLPTL